MAWELDTAGNGHSVANNIPKRVCDQKVPTLQSVGAELFLRNYIRVERNRANPLHINFILVGLLGKASRPFQYLGQGFTGQDFVGINAPELSAKGDPCCISGYENHIPVFKPNIIVLVAGYEQFIQVNGIDNLAIAQKLNIAIATLRSGTSS